MINLRECEIHVNKLFFFLILKKKPHVSMRSCNYHFKDLYRDHYVPTWRLRRTPVYISFPLWKLCKCPCSFQSWQSQTREQAGPRDKRRVLSWLCGLWLTWITPSIMLTILWTMAITLWVRSVGLTSGLHWLDNTYRHAIYNTYVGDNLKWTVELLV